MLLSHGLLLPRGSQTSLATKAEALVSRTGYQCTLLRENPQHDSETHMHSVPIASNDIFCHERGLAGVGIPICSQTLGKKGKCRTWMERVPIIRAEKYPPPLAIGAKWQALCKSARLVFKPVHLKNINLKIHKP